MKQVKISAFVLALVACAPLAAFAQGIAGDWELTLDTPQGANTVNLTLTQAGDKITGTLSSPMGAVQIAGTATGADWKATGNIDAGGAALEMGFTGKIAGDTQTGSVKFGDFGEFPFTGKRAGAKATGAPAAAAAAAAPAVAASTAGGAASAGNISGKWDVMLSVPGAGDLPALVTITQAAEKVTGTISSAAGGDVAIAGTMTGNALKLQFTAETPNGNIPVTMTGTLAAGAFTGKATIEGLGEADWTGKRAQQ
jgi:hypothetical protein